MHANIPVAELLSNLSWHRISLSLSTRRALGGKGTPPLVILNAFLKSIKPETRHEEKVRLAFCVPNEYAHRIQRRAGQAVALEIDCFGATEEWLRDWCTALTRHIAEAPHAGFDLDSAPHVDAISGSTLLEPADASHAELEFLAPLPFKRDKGSSRTQSLEGHPNRFRLYPSSRRKTAL